jgi:hypothetical protein
LRPQQVQHHLQLGATFKKISLQALMGSISEPAVVGPEEHKTQRNSDDLQQQSIFGSKLSGPLNSDRISQ